MVWSTKLDRLFNLSYTLGQSEIRHLHPERNQFLLHLLHTNHYTNHSSYSSTIFRIIVRTRLKMQNSNLAGNFKHIFFFSISDNGPAAKSQSGSNCITDFLEIPNGQTDTIAAITTAAAGITRFCGRNLSTAGSATASTTVCSKLKTCPIDYTIPAKKTITSNV